jgi:hypothetical protein
LFVSPFRDFRLVAGAPVIDRGSPRTPHSGRTDFAGGKRFVDGGSGAATIDMGAYEFQR